MQERLETDICQFLSKPYAYNNKILRVRGYLSLNFEHSMLADAQWDKALWLAFADGSAPSTLLVTLSGTENPVAKTPGGGELSLCRFGWFETETGSNSKALRWPTRRSCIRARMPA